MTDDQKRRIDDHRPSVALQWNESGALPARIPFDRPEQWTILLTSANHGLVGAYGHTFQHATGDHVRVNVYDEATVRRMECRIRELEDSQPTAASAASIEGLTDARIKELSNTNRGPKGLLINDIGFARAIEREVLATQSAKQGAQAAPKQSTTINTGEFRKLNYAYASKLFDAASGSDATNSKAFKALVAYIDERCAAVSAAPASPEQAAQVQADVRDQALEDAATRIDTFVSEQLDPERMECGRDIAVAIRAMKSTCPATSEGEKK